jgi:hypothetical protein
VNNPIQGQDNLIFVRVGNRGTQTAQNVRVDLLTRHGAGAETWINPNATPGAWAVIPAAPTAPPAGNIPSGGHVDFGPFLWAPQQTGRHAIFARVTTADDLSNADGNSVLPCAAGPIRVEQLVPFDNNLGYRVWQVA